MLLLLLKMMMMLIVEDTVGLLLERGRCVTVVQ